MLTSPTDSGSESDDVDSNIDIIAFADGAVAEREQLQLHAAQQQKEAAQYAALSAKVKALVHKLAQAQAESKSAAGDLQRSEDQNKELKAQIEALKEQQEVSNVCSDTAHRVTASASWL